MKKSYATPEVSVVMFENEDIVTTSNLLTGFDPNSYSYEDIESNFTNWLN